MMNIIEMIDKLSEQFESFDLCYGHGTDNAHDEAVALVFHVLQLPFDVDDTLLKRILKEEERQMIIDLANRRIVEKKPLPYLTNTAYFAGIPFYVDERVIIPRSPFAEVINRGFAPWISPERVHSVLDLCTGSGCMAIVTAIAFPNAIVDAVELDDKALEVAEINRKKHALNHRVRLFQADLFEGLFMQSYDVIMSNPPYVSPEEMAQLPQEFYHEPKAALEANDEGLEIVLRILKEASNHLSLNGILLVEVGNGQEALERRLPHVPFTWIEFEHGGSGVFVLTREQLESVNI